MGAFTQILSLICSQNGHFFKGLIPSKVLTGYNLQVELLRQEYLFYKTSLIIQNSPLGLTTWMLHTCTVCVEEFNCTSEYSKHSQLQYLKGFWHGSRCCHWPFILLFSYNSIHLHTSYNCNKQEKLFLTYGSVDRTTPCREPAALKYPDPQIHKVYILAWHLIDLDKQITVIMNMTLSSYSN